MHTTNKKRRYKPMKTVRLGVIGLGARGTFIIRTPLLPLMHRISAFPL